MIFLVLVCLFVLVRGGLVKNEVDSVGYRFSLGVETGNSIYKVFEIGDGQLFHGNTTVQCLTGNSTYQTPDPCGNCELAAYCKVRKSPQYIVLTSGVLRNQRGAIGEIVANHQFQFDLPSQPDALFNKGWSIVSWNGKLLLALNGDTQFWHCQAGTNGLYKLYNASIGGQCSPVYIVVLQQVW